MILPCRPWGESSVEDDRRTGAQHGAEWIPISLCTILDISYIPLDSPEPPGCSVIPFGSLPYSPLRIGEPLGKIDLADTWRFMGT